jgi:DNA polymerase III subunit gamma/tau
MDNYIVSARKYRPDTFDSVVGQQSITSTLKNAIRTKHLAHAYLFCGPRGVGKTTAARIFAKTINCYNLSSEVEACNQCKSCKAFNEHRSYNIHELDAASNNSVEDIRNLIDQVRIPPQVGSHSVYIIDEVHMLSAQAFNAFLKTLEEPPKHAIFILATTEKHKIIPTILSRCQIFDFNRIRIEDIVQHLAFVAKSEHTEVEPEALNVIAQKAEGGMRDALSYFDQLVSFSGQNITYKTAIENLNVLDYDYYFRLVDAFNQSNIPESLIIFDEILSKGFDGHHFINGLNSHLRDILVCKDHKTIDLLEVGTSIKNRYKEQADACSVAFLLSALDICNNCDIQYKASNNKRLHVELALIRLSNILNDKKKSIETTEKHEDKESNQVSKETETNLKQKEKKTQKKYTPQFSIKQAIEKETTKNKEIDAVNDNDGRTLTGPHETFTQNDLENAWKKVAEAFKDSPRFYHTINSTVPFQKEDESVILDVNNVLQQDEINEKLKDILPILKRELKNINISLETKIATSNKQQKAFTKEDKYKLLMKKNPNLDLLRKKFNLDF